MLRKGLEAAGVEFRDGVERVADFHVLRHTFITNLVRAGAPVAMEWEGGTERLRPTRAQVRDEGQPGQKQRPGPEPAPSNGAHCWNPRLGPGPVSVSDVSLSSLWSWHPTGWTRCGASTDVTRVRKLATLMWVRRQRLT